ncbi:MAG TPA: WD40 repeat domain-containing protein [Propionibacteriaceae bacterium]|nr:WD40 repeat domain-containing protein [Propionibacteriaceae bacterium]
MQDEKHLSLRNKPFREGIGELAAAVLNTTKDRMVGEELRVRRRNAGWLIAAATVLVLALAGAVTALSMSVRNAETALAGRLASRALQLDAQHSDTSPLLAAEAIAIKSTPEAVSAGVQVLYQRGPMLGYVDGIGSLESMVFAADGTALIERQGDISTFDLRSLRPGSAFRADAMGVMAVSHDGAMAVVRARDSKDNDNDIRLVDCRTGAVKTLDIGGDDYVDSSVLSADGDHLLLALHSGVVQRMNLRNGSIEPPTRLRGFQPDKSVVSFAEDGRALAVRSGRDNIAYYGIDATGTLAQPIIFGASFGFEGVYQIAISPDGRYVAGAAGDSQAAVTVVDVKKREKVAYMQFPSTIGSIGSVDLSNGASSPLVATEEEGHGASVWTGWDNQALQRVLTNSDVDSVALAPDGSTLLTSNDGRVAVADLKRPPVASVVRNPPMNWRVDVLDEGTTTYILNHGGLTAQEGGASPEILEMGYKGLPGVLVQSGAGVQLVTVSDHRLRSYSVKQRAWRDLATDQHGEDQWTAVQATFDHRFLIAKSKSRLTLLDPTTGAERFSVKLNEAEGGVSGDVDANGERFAWWSTQAGSVNVVELATNQRWRIDLPDRSVQDAAFLPDGRLVVASGSGLSVFNPDASSKTATWPLPDLAPTFIAPDGGFLAVVAQARGGQSQLLVYSNATGQPALKTDLLPGSPLRIIAGRRLTAVTQDKTVEVEPVWRDSQELIRQLCASVARPLTLAERKTYLSGKRARGCQS